ncbi:MAG: LPS export ABC transporter periplasmic protein LptC, partial [Desulfobacterales bacterium]|nr:LPS export ABC transporter periplasmic protein LptC [Desulfobacterales bacterium]
MLKKNPRTLKIVFALCIVTTIGLLSVAYFKYRRILDKPEEFITAIQPGVDMAIDDIHQTATRDGKKEWQLDAATAHYLEAEKKIRLDRLTMTFFIDNQPPIHLTADSGTLETETRNVMITGHVELKNEDSRLLADELHYRHETQFLFAQSPVEIIGDGYQLNADSMTLELDKKR